MAGRIVSRFGFVEEPIPPTQVTLRFKTTSQRLIDDLSTSWLESEGAVIIAGGHRYAINLTYVKEQARE